MLSLSSYEEVMPSRQSLSAPFDDVECPLLAFWLCLAFLYHVLVIAIDGIDNFRSVLTAPLSFRVSSHSFRGVCPKRKARWYKCAKRCEKRCEKQTPTEECYFSKCAMNLVKLHLPPPLPLKPKKKSEKKIVRELKSVKEEGNTLTPRAEEKSSPRTPPSASSATAQQVHVRSQVRPSVPLIDLARMQYWDLVLEQVSRRGAKYRDSDGLYPLHWACSGGPPSEVIQALLDAYPSAARKTDKEGSTALHFATHYSASASVVETVLLKYPKAASVQDRYGRTPLYHAVEKSAGLDVLDRLVRTDPSLVTLPCLPHDRRNIPISRAVAQRTPLYMAWSAVLLDRKARQTRRGRKWEKAQLLLEAAYNHLRKNKSTGGASYSFLSAAIALDLYLPEEVVSMAVTMHPEQLEQQDLETGRLPLLQAAATALFSRGRSDNVIALLLRSYPSGANARDRDGKSALHLALESGKPWTAGVGRLFGANPDAIHWVDEAGLSPALAAATVATNVSDEEEPKEMDENPLGLLTPKHKELIRRRRLELLKPTAGERGMTGNEQMSTILDLLLADPSVVSAIRR